jgi:hypothetical protein
MNDVLAGIRLPRRSCVIIALLVCMSQTAMAVAEAADTPPAERGAGNADATPSDVKTPEPKAQPIDPKSLLGEWRGTMTAMDDPGWVAKVLLTVRRVSLNGQYVFGDIEVSSPGVREGRTRRFRAALNGNELHFDRGAGWVLTINAGRMSGHWYGGSGHWTRHGGADIVLTK